MRSTRSYALVLFAVSIIGCNYYDGPGACSIDRPYDPCERGLCDDAGVRRDASASDGRVEACTLDDECAAGRVCERGVCVPAAPCADDRDCDPGLVCDARGTCVDAPIAGCRSSSECGAEDVCVEGSCRPLDDVCHADLDCGAGRGCVDNACRPLCLSDAECGESAVCDAGHCRPVPDCTTSDGCDPGELCVDARCTIGCASAADCAAEEVCEAGVCRPDVAPRPFCLSDADCVVGHPCIDGVCRTPCPSGTDDECRRADVQLTACAAPDGLFLCFTHAETSPECVTPADCAADEACIDASCR